MTGIIRPLKDGGCSICRALDQNIGKRRCRHILDNADIHIINHTHGLNTIDISGSINGEDETFSISATTNEIKSYIKNLSDGLSAEEKQSILNTLRES